jgi:hypothetical protein
MFSAGYGGSPATAGAAGSPATAGAGAGGGGLSPYTGAGSQAIQQYLQSIMGMKDPAAWMKNIMGGYSQSPSAQIQQEAAMRSANQAGAASGMLGSGAEQSQIARQAQGISQEDQQRYLQNIMGVQGQFLGGLGGISQMGEQGVMGQMQQQMQQQQLDEKHREFDAWIKEKGQSGMWGNIAGGVGAAAAMAAHFLPAAAV